MIVSIYLDDLFVDMIINSRYHYLEKTQDAAYNRFLPHIHRMQNNHERNIQSFIAILKPNQFASLSNRCLFVKILINN